MDGVVMCILMVIHQCVEGYPIVLAANRDEHHDRPAQAPDVLQQSPVIWGGRDVRAGGTWLGVNEYGLVVGLTNRRMYPEQANDPKRRSRGLLCLDILQLRSAEAAAAFLDRVAIDLYNPFNVLTLDRDKAYWIAYDGMPQIQRLTTGLYVLANGNLDDVETIRIRRARHLLQRTAYTDLQTLLPFLEEVCRDHELGVKERETICMHRPQDNYGTVSSTILALSSDLRHSVYRYVDGSPCMKPYEAFSFLFQN
ncbi:MAG: NRDE family protein [bacterium]|nr:NRDE family protein [bacterium]